MSVQHANRGIVKKDLQLYYNREFSKSFKGEATTNLLRRTTTFDAIFWDGYCGPATNVTYNTTDVVDTLGRYNAIKVIRNGNNTCDGAGRVAMGFLYYGPTILVAGQTYTMSFYARSAVAGTLLRGGLNDVHTFGYVTLTTSWVRYSFTFTNISNTSRGFQFISDQAVAGETYYICYPQVENKAYVTPYCDITENINVRAVTATNLLTTTYSSLPTNWAVDSSGQGTIGTYSYIENNSAIRIVDVNSNTRFNTGYLSGFSASTDYTFSVKYRKVSGTPTLRFQLQFYNSSNVLVGSVSFPTTPQINIYDINGWQLASYTVTSPASTAKVLWFIQDGDDYTGYTHSYDLKEPQIQTGTVPTAWTSNTATANTLTSGGGLLDISGNNVNADLTNVSFDSSGYYFAGTSSVNRIQFTTPASFIYSAAGKTILMWIKYSSTGYVGFCGLGNAANGQSFNLRSSQITPQYLGFMGYNADYDPVAGPQINNNVWHLIGATFDAYGAGNLKLYVDGLNTASTTLTLNTAPEASNIGYIGRSSHTGSEGYMAGQVGQFMMYNRPLSADEILQIFNSQRKTYGI